MRRRPPPPRSSRTRDREGVNCPVCSGDTRVLRTDEVERRRECVRCGHRFPTVEILKDEHQRRETILKEAKALAEKLVA